MKTQTMNIKMSKSNILIKSDQEFHFQKHFRLYAYSVISTPISVIYFGGYQNGEAANDIVAEYRNLKWTKLGTLASGRYQHRSIQMGTKIYIFGGEDKT